jgi:GAF domain-containing protein
MKKTFWSYFESNVDRNLVLNVLGVMIAISVFIVAGRIVTVLFNQILIGAFAFILIIAWVLAYRGQLELGRVVAPILAFLIISTLAVRGGLRDTSVLGFSGVTLVAGLLLGEYGGLLFGGLGALVIFVISFCEANGIIDTYLAQYTAVPDGIIASTLVLAATLVQWLLTRRLSQAVQAARRNEQSQAAANEELRILQSTLEMRISDRTSAVEESAAQIHKRAVQLEAISDVSRSIANIQDLDQLLPAITRFISERFGFYHVGIFLIDAKREFVILRAANSVGGQKMVQREHKLRFEASSLVGYAASRGRARIALDVGTDAVFFSNPDLPETRSEIALPLISAEHVIGVLDVQSRDAGAFSQEDATVLGALANQIAIALENARLFAETRQALAEAEQAYQQYLGTGWRRAAHRTAQLGYESSAPGQVAPLSRPLELQIETAVPGGKAVTKSDLSAGILTVPIKVRGEIIGVLNVRSEESGRAWSSDEVTLVNAVAERAALALENARLVQEAQRRATKERLIGEIANKIAGAGSIQDIVQTAVKELGTAMHSTDVTIQFQQNQK